WRCPARTRAGRSAQRASEAMTEESREPRAPSAQREGVRALVPAARLERVEPVLGLVSSARGRSEPRLAADPAKTSPSWRRVGPENSDRRRGTADSWGRGAGARGRAAAAARTAWGERVTDRYRGGGGGGAL